MNTSPFQSHNHKRCQQAALKAAQSICEQHGERLTPLRKTVFEFVWSSHEPVKAYDLLGKLKMVHPSSAPPTVYRALDFLQSLGLVHKIESLNAYLGCSDPSGAHRCQFLICRQCGSVAELDDDVISNDIQRLATAMDFQYEAMSLEIHGVCSGCKG